MSDSGLIPGALASVLGLATLGDQPIPALVAHLQNTSMLIVLDNCEHALDAVAVLVESLLRGAPGVHVLATSRQPVRAEGEFLYHITALAVPPRDGVPPVADALRFPAVELFADRASASLDTFELTDDNVVSVVDICHRLDGIPLAIELAAARVGTLGLDGLALRLNDCFSVLTKGRRTACHATRPCVRHWIGTSSSSPMQRSSSCRDWRRWSAISPWRRPSRSVRDRAGGVSVDAMDAFTGLIEKSLVATDVSGNVMHYRLLSTTRAYALEKLRLNGEAEAMGRCHAAYFVQLARQAEKSWETLPAAQWLSVYGRGIDDMRVAIDWAFSGIGELAIGLDLMIATAPLWFQLSLMDEYRERLQRALERITGLPLADPAREARLRIALGHAIWYSANDVDRMQDAFTRALEIAEEIGDHSAQLQALWGMWAALRSRGAYQAALGVAKKYEEVAVGFGDPKFVSLANRILSVNNHYLGRQDQALCLIASVQGEAARSDPDRGGSANNDFQLDRSVAMTALSARIAWLQGFPDRAAAAAREAVEIALRTRHVLSLGYALCMAGCPVALWNGDLRKPAAAPVCCGNTPPGTASTAAGAFATSGFSVCAKAPKNRCCWQPISIRGSMCRPSGI